VLAPLAVLMLVMGVAPTYWLQSIEKSSSPAGIMHQVQFVTPASNSNLVSASNAAEAHR